MSDAIDKLMNCGGLCTPEEYQFVANKIAATPAPNVLIFGMGADSHWWPRVNTGGNFLFVEESREYFDKFRNQMPNAEFIMGKSRVHYDDWKDCGYISLEGLLIQEVPHNFAPDIVLIDGPCGSRHFKEFVGRQCSAYTASYLSLDETVIFMHDMDREIEQEIADYILKQDRFLEQDRVGRMAWFDKWPI